MTPARKIEETASHTKGPWTYEVHELSEGFSAIVYAANGMRVGTDHLSEPDARLIAAAPEMAQELLEVADALDVAAHWKPSMAPHLAAKIRELLTRATGAA